MAKRMLIDATHPEETRVVVLNGNRLEEFDFETSTKKQVKGNIYLAKVTRVEPSLQAAFVEYGGNRHGFLAFSEIHPDYYRIPVADRRHSGASQSADPVSFDTAGEVTDEGGVPLEEALPEPVAVVELSPEDAAENETFSNPIDHNGESDILRPTTEPDERDDFGWGAGPHVVHGDSGERASEPVSTEFPQAGPVQERSLTAEQPAEPTAEATSPVDLPDAPARGWVTAAAGNEVVFAPDDPAATRLAAEQAGRSAAPHEARGAPHETSAHGDIVEIVEVRALDGGGYEVVDLRSPAERDTEAGETRTLDDREGDATERHSYRMDVRDAHSAGDGDYEAAGARYSGNGESEGVELPSSDHENGVVEARTAVDGENGESEVVETLGGDDFEEVETQRSRAHRHYKIQEVIKRRQIMLVQVTKEERGNKGAALTTYLSLAGRYCVLMPNTARGGGVSRKITNLPDRRRLKDLLEELEIPEGMGVIVRTAGAERSKAEIKRDYEYLLRLWNEIRELTLRSTAPALIYEEGDLIKRSIRDLYTRDIDEVLVEGEEGYRTAKSFMKMLMPSHAKRVQPYRDPQIGLLHRFQVESQIDAIHSPVVQLRSGGYVVIDQTEALVAIDVNSGRSTRERNIEETALRTNLEAAEEIARQLRLRDLAGLIVIDFIDMEEYRNQGAVERRLKEALKNDRARIQVGRISPFGLLEMSRQRLRSSLVEASTQPCPHCGGTGTIRSTESTALYVLRSIEEEGIRRRSAEVCVYVPTTVALYILNYKRDSLAQLEARYGIHVLIARDDTLIPPAFRLERLRSIEPGEAPAVVSAPLTQAPEIDEDHTEEDFDEITEGEDAERPGGDGEDERGRARRRRRRRRRHEDERGRPSSPVGDEQAEEPLAAQAAEVAVQETEGDQEGEDDSEAGRARRRRGRRGGRRRGRREDNGGGTEIGHAAADTVEIVPTDAGGAAEEGFLDEPEPVEATESVRSQPIYAEPALATAATEIETASLPALAGDGMPSERPEFCFRGNTRLGRNNPCARRGIAEDR